MADELAGSVSSGSSSSDSGGSSQPTAAPASGSTGGFRPSSFADSPVWETGVPQVPGQQADGSAPAPDQTQQQQGIPPDDSDLAALGNQPGVQAIRQAREHGRQLERELYDARQQLDAANWSNQMLNHYGGPQVVNTAMGLVQQAVNGDSRGYWSNLHGVSPAIAGNLLGQAVDMWPNEIAQALVQRGYILDYSQMQYQQPSQYPVDPQEYELIPEPFRGIWGTMPQDQRFDLLAVNESTREAVLQNLLQSAEYQQLQQEVEQERAVEHQQAIQQQVVQIGQDFIRDVTQAVFQQLQQQVRLTGNDQYDGALQVILTGFLRDAIQNDPQMRQAIAVANGYASRMDRLNLANMSQLFQARASQILNSVLPVLQSPFTSIRQVQARQQAVNQQQRIPPQQGAVPQNQLFNGQNGVPNPELRGQWNKERLMQIWDNAGRG